MSGWDKKYKNFVALTDEELKQIYAKSTYNSKHNFYHLTPDKLYSLIEAIKNISDDAVNNNELLTRAMLAHKLGVTEATFKIWTYKIPDVKTAYHYFISKMRVLYDNMHQGFFSRKMATKYKLNVYGYEAFKTFGRHALRLSEQRELEIENLSQAKNVKEKALAINKAVENGGLTANEYVQVSSAISQQLAAEKTEVEIQAYKELGKVQELEEKLNEVLSK